LTSYAALSLGSRRVTADAQIGLTPRNLRRGILSSGLANLVALPLSLVVLPVILRKLSAADYGVWAAVSTVVVIGGLADLGVAAEITRRVAAGLGTGSARRSARRGLGLLAAAALVVVGAGELGASGLVHIIFGSHTATAHQALPLLRVSLALMAASLVASGLSAVLQGLQRSDVVNIVTCASGVVSVVLIVATISSLKVWALVLGTGVATAIQLCAYAVRARQLLPVAPTPAAAAMVEPRYFRLSLLVLVPAVCNVVDWQLDKLLIAHFVSAAATGGYQIGSTIGLELRNVLLLPLGMLLPALAERRELTTGDTLPNLRTIFYSATGLLFGALLTLGPSLMNVWLGTHLAAANTSVQWLAVALAINCATAPFYFHALANLWHRDVARSAVANAVVNAAVSWSLVPWLGLRGPLLGSVVGNVVGLIALAGLMRRRGSRYVPRESCLGLALLCLAVLVAMLEAHLGSATRWLAGATWCGLAAVVFFGFERRRALMLAARLR
jgi:O-antigen/teichoic acid export membrane protein